MSKATHKRHSEATLADGASIDSACRAFEMELVRGRRPSLEALLVGWEEPERSKLLYELLRLEIDQAHRDGTQPSAEAFLQRFPGDRVVIDEAFDAIASLATLPPAIQGAEAQSLVVQSVFGALKYVDKGGLGIVYRAEDQKLKRNTAVKFIQEAFVDDLQSREQFLLEAEITGRLEHPGVVPVYGLGEASDGRPFYAMRFIQGETLDAAIARFHAPPGHGPASGEDRQVDFHDLLSRFVSVCKTIAYAHIRGIVHRDIKPANVMLGLYGETIVIDWGLAAHVERRGVFKDRAEETLMPAARNDPSHVSRGGTPAYMSPEQAAAYLDSDGNALAVELGPATDIYSLGATLYTLLAGGTPFKGKVSEVMQRVVLGDFLRPTYVSRHVSKSLEAVCLKAMALDPRNRYATALELADDVERYLADAPVSAYREPLGRRLARWTRRHRVLAQTGLATLAALTLVAILSSAWLRHQAQLEKQLRTTAETAQKNEHALRVRGLEVSAEFAARTIANQIDIRWRVLEKEAADMRLHALLTDINTGPQDERSREALQEWLDARISQDYEENLPSRNWFVQSLDGTQVARFPSQDESGEPYSSLGRGFAFRDYFHGRHRDYLPADLPANTAPLPGPHNSTALRSVNGGDLSVVFSAPIRTSDAGDPIGVLGMSIHLGSFADLKIPLPEGQGVLLVDTRPYYMLREDLSDYEESGEGLVLHHQDLPSALNRKPLPHLPLRQVNQLREAKTAWLVNTAPPDRLLENYRDPVNPEQNGRWIAAFAPVLVKARPAEQQDTGWFVIVQQHQPAAIP